MNSQYKCHICDKTCTGPVSFEQHQNSDKHKKKVALHRDRPTNPTPDVNLVDNNLQLISCNTCNVQLRGMQSFQAHVNSLQHADMVRKVSSASNGIEDQLECTIEKSEITELNAINNPGPSIPYEGYNVTLGSVAHCVICKMQFSGTEQHQQHLDGKNHKKKLKLLGLSTLVESGSSKPVIAEAKNGMPIATIPSDLQCEACQMRFSGPFPYQQHLVSESHKKKTIQKELMAVKLSFDTVDNDKIRLFIKNQEKEAASNDTTLASHEEGSSSDDSGDNQPFAVCTPCNMQFSGPDPYQLHVESAGHQKKIGIQRNSVNLGFKCDVCNMTFSGPIPYNDHLDSSKHKKKAQNVVILNQLQTNESLDQDYTQSDKINGVPSGINSEYFCVVCEIHANGPEPYRQHMYSERHKKKARAVNAFCNVENANHLQNGLSENNLNHNFKTNEFYLSRDMILCDGIKNIGVVPVDDLNVQIFFPDDEIVFDKPLKKNVV